MSNLQKGLMCTVCDDWYTEPRRLHGSHVFCAKCLEGLQKNDEGQVQCPLCQELQTLPESGVDGLFLEVCLIEMLNYVRCKDCDGYHGHSRNCVKCQKAVCPPCRGKHNTEHLLTLIKEVEEMEPSEEVKEKARQKSAEWKEVGTSITKLRRILNEKADHLTELIEKERGKKIAELDELEEKAKQRESELELSVVSTEFVKSGRDHMTAAEQSQSEIRENDFSDLDKVQVTLSNMISRLTEDTKTVKNETEELIRIMTRMTALMESEYESVETETDLHLHGEEMQTRQAIVDAHTETVFDIHHTGVQVNMDTNDTTTPRVYNGVKRKIDVKANVPCITQIFGIAICPLTGQVYVTGRSEKEHIIVVYDKHEQFIRHFTVGANNSLMPFIAVNKRGELMITRCDQQVESILFVNQYGEVLRRLDTGALCMGITTDHDGNIYVSRDKHILKLDDKGNVIQKIGEGILERAGFISGNNNKLYLSSHKKCIFVFSLDGRLISEIDSGTERNQGASDVCIDKDGQILWCDRVRQCIHVYTPSGEYLTSIDNLQHAFGIAQLLSGDIAVVNWNCRVNIL